MRRITLSDGTFYPPIFDLCHCKKYCGTIVYGGKRYEHGHHTCGVLSKLKGTEFTEEHKIHMKESGRKRYSLSDGSWYPPIFDLCWCGCGEIVCGGKRFINKHQSRIREGIKGEASHFKRPEVKEKLKIAMTKTFLLCPDGSKEIYPPIPITCQCRNVFCNEICYGGKSFVSGHNNYIDGRSNEPYCFRWTSKLREEIRIRDNYTCQLCGVKQSELIGFIKKLDVHHIHYDKKNCEPDLITLCHSCNLSANWNCNHYENLFMNMLNNRQLLFWTLWKQKKTLRPKQHVELI